MPARPAVTLRIAAPDDRPTLRRLMQLYCYDFSEFTNIPLHDDGLFGDPPFIEEQLGPDHRQFLLYADGRLAGFAIVTPASYLTGDTHITDMTQFFVVRAERMQGVGAAAASQLFNRYPGKWEVRVIDTNLPAQAFWRTAIDRHTHANFAEEFANTHRHHGPVFTFTTAS